MLFKVKITPLKSLPNFKIILALACFILSFQNSFSQNKTIDVALNNIITEKNENKKVDLYLDLYTRETEGTPALLIEMGKKLLSLSQKTNDIAMQAGANSMLGHGFRMLGNSVKGLKYHQTAVDLARENGNVVLFAMTKNQMAHVYKDRGEYKQALELYLAAKALAEKGKNQQVLIYVNMNLGFIYLNMEQFDAALTCTQKAYELSLKINSKKSLSYILEILGRIHTKLGNLQLAYAYCKMAVKEVIDDGNKRYLIHAYTGLAEYFKKANQVDSCLIYSKKAIGVVKNSPFFYLSIAPAKMIADIYKKSNCDSTLKYLEIYQNANDSLFSKKNNEQMQSMTFDDNMHQIELARGKKEQEEEQKHQIQFALIAIGIVVLLFLYLLLSRSFITSTQLIEFFGVMALLIVFEFLNLILHPFLENITNHTPILMLLALVCIAGMLIPLHHKLEKWATNKLVKKNKEIRLANAKKTIETLKEEEASGEEK